MKKWQIVLSLLLVSDTYLSEIVKPRMCYFYNPSTWLSIWMFPIRIFFLFAQIFSSQTYMRNISSRDYLYRAVSPTYPASRQRCSSISSGASYTFAESTEVSILTSCVLAPHMTIESGMPYSSTRRFLFTPFFSPICRISTDRLFSHRRFHHTSIQRLPCPTYTFQLIILS